MIDVLHMYCLIFNQLRSIIFFQKLNIYRVISFDHFDSNGISNHQSLLLHYNILPHRKKLRKIEIRNHTNIDVDMSERLAERIDWFPLYLHPDINRKVEFLIQSMSFLHNTAAPLKTIITKHELNPWMNTEIKQLLKIRDRFREMVKFNRRNHKQIAFNAYKNANKIVKPKINDVKKSHFIYTINLRIQ